MDKSNDPGFVKLKPGAKNLQNAFYGGVNYEIADDSPCKMEGWFRKDLKFDRTLGPTFKYSTTQLCEALQVHRDFVGKHLRTLPHVYLSQTESKRVSMVRSGGTPHLEPAYPDKNHGTYYVDPGFMWNCRVRLRCWPVRLDKWLGIDPSDLEERHRKLAANFEWDKVWKDWKGWRKDIRKRFPEFDRACSLRSITNAEWLDFDIKPLPFSCWLTRGYEELYGLRTLADIRGYGQTNDWARKRAWNCAAPQVELTFQDGARIVYYAEKWARPLFVLEDEDMVPEYRIMVLPLSLMPDSYVQKVVLNKHLKDDFPHQARLDSLYMKNLHKKKDNPFSLRGDPFVMRPEWSF